MAGKPKVPHAVLCKDYRSGMGYSEIAEKRGINKSTIYRAIAKIISVDERTALLAKRRRAAGLTGSCSAQAESLASGRFIIERAEGVLLATTAGMTFKLDVCDDALLRKYAWRATPDKRLVRQSSLNGSVKNIYISHDVMGELPSRDFVIDHINRDTLDNRRANLRKATYAQNAANRPPHRSAAVPYKGVVLKDYGRFAARIKDGPKARHIGSFKTAQEAAVAYDVAALAAFGDFAWLNSHHFSELAE